MEHELSNAAVEATKREFRLINRPNPLSEALGAAPLGTLLPRTDGVRWPPHFSTGGRHQWYRPVGSFRTTSATTGRAAAGWQMARRSARPSRMNLMDLGSGYVGVLRG